MNIAAVVLRVCAYDYSRCGAYHNNRSSTRYRGKRQEDASYLHHKRRFHTEKPITQRSMPSPRQLGVLLCGEVDVDAASTPSADVAVELLEARAFRVTAGHEGAEIVECGEAEVARLRAYGSAAIGLDEVNDPVVVVVVEVHQDDGHVLVLSAEGGSANASQHSSVLGMVGVLSCERGAGKAKEDFAGVVAPVLIAEPAEHSDVVFGEVFEACRMCRRQSLHSTTDAVGFRRPCWQ
jgi:hypothetical protein